MLATPLRVIDILIGQLTWIALRLLVVSTIFFAVMVAFGAVAGPAAVLAIPAAVLDRPGVRHPDRRVHRHAARPTAGSPRSSASG